MSLSREQWSVRSARLVALLDFIERPAAVLTPDGALLGANVRFADLAACVGQSDPDGLASLVATAERGPLDEALREVAGAAAGSEDRPVRFIDGVLRRVRLERHGAAGEHSPLLAVVDARSAEPGARARGSLGHDVAGPLTAILGTAELLLIRGADLPPTVRTSLGNILENCGRITEILARDRAARARRRDGANRDDG